MIASAEAAADAAPARGPERQAIATAARQRARRWASDRTPCSRRPTAVRLSASPASDSTPPADSAPFLLASLARVPRPFTCRSEVLQDPVEPSANRRASVRGNRRPPQPTVLTSTSHQGCPGPPSRRQRGIAPLPTETDPVPAGDPERRQTGLLDAVELPGRAGRPRARVRLSKRSAAASGPAFRAPSCFRPRQPSPAPDRCSCVHVAPGMPMSAFSATVWNRSPADRNRSRSCRRL